MTKYTKIKDYEPITMPDEETSVLSACCDCGLVHWYVLAEDKQTGERCILAIKDKRRTAQLRRHSYGALHNGNGKWRMIRRVP